MSGAPKDVPGACNARLTIADDWGDNSATMRCPLDPGHTCPHSEAYNAGRAGKVVITWEKDQRELCCYCKQPMGLDVDDSIIVEFAGNDEDFGMACPKCAAREAPEGAPARRPTDGT